MAKTMLKIPDRVLLTLFIAGFGFSVLSIFFLDRFAYEIIRPAFASQQVLWQNITYLGDSEWMAILTLAIIATGLVLNYFQPRPLWVKMWRYGTFLFIPAAIAGISALLLKNMIGRARPYVFDTEGPLGFSPFAFENNFAGFPSGHTTMAFAFATMLAILFPRLAAPAFAIAILAGFSRMAVNAHYLGDVIFGATFGTIVTIFAAKKLATKFKYRT